MGIVVSTVLLLTLETQAAYSALAVEGDVFIVTGGSKKPLNPGQKIPNGATIQTGKDGQAILQWGESFDLYEVTPETRIKISGKKIIGGEGKKNAARGIKKRTGNPVRSLVIRAVCPKNPTSRNQTGSAVASFSSRACLIFS